MVVRGALRNRATTRLALAYLIAGTRRGDVRLSVPAAAGKCARTSERLYDLQFRAVHRSPGRK